MRKLIFFLLAALSIPLLWGQNDGVITSHNRPNDQATLDKPYVVLLSIDGFRHDYVEKYGAKNIAKIAEQGVQSASLIPCFPSSTFPNHYSIVTGMYPARHGLVSNTFYDPHTFAKYKISDRTAVQNGEWYGGKPIWVHAEQQGMRSASYFWVGSEADIEGIHPFQYYIYNSKTPYKACIAQGIDWLEMPDKERPHFITLYFSTVDSKGHASGPDSKDVEKAVKQVDKLVGKLWKKLQKTDLPVNLVIVSDHGMQRTLNDSPIYLESLANLSGYKIAKSSGVINLLYAENKDSVNIEKTIEELKENANGRYHVYRPEETPPHLHYSDNERLGDIIVYSIPPHVFGNPKWKPSPGAHGFDPEDSKDLHGIFYAIGPQFQSNFNLPSVENIHIFPVIMEILQLDYDPEGIDGELGPLAPSLKK